MTEPTTRREARDMARRSGPGPVHGHAHGPAAPTTRRVRLTLAALLVPLLLGTLAGLVALWPAADDVPDRIPVAAEGSTILRGTVTGPVDEATSSVPARLDDGSRAGGEDVGGDEITVQAPPEYVAFGFETGDRLRVLYIEGAEAGGGTPYVFLDFERGLPIGILAAAYALVVLAVARWRGLAALAGLAGAFAVIGWFTLPALLTGQDALGVALVTSSLVMFVVLYVAHGFSARTSTALLGTLIGLALTALLGSWGSGASNITGLTSEESLWIPQYAPALDIQGVVLCGIVLAGMGVLNDVTITQASAVWELRAVAPHASRFELFTRAMRIGRDHIASTVYTIAFAYVGAALPLLMAVYLSDQGIATSLTSGEIAEEVVRTLVGSIGLVLAIPATTAIAAVTVPGATAAAPVLVGTVEVPSRPGP
ncbi:YibE/F family protein [Cellulosimicrobium marinum]|uniref:YibE/F family protein n=1 Tax=Cellulosimicrobium marinum TaxID=1638992 RepID=UPI001E65381E|nr:YibE/F family protein [Cellulosimicrobium marinum]MCB7135628.1 YibE/F family protein [Cellulosimicrobium marinum]